ncbi:hypothetical protein C289_2005, partial [Anoxybacillus ayderensis]
PQLQGDISTIFVFILPMVPIFFGMGVYDVNIDRQGGESYVDSTTSCIYG